MRLLTAAQSRELDRLSQEKYGIPSYSLMTSAGEAVAAALIEKYRNQAMRGVVALAGKGNNGGDSMVAARKLKQEGIPVRAILLGKAAALKGDAVRAYAEFVSNGGTVAEAESESDLEAAFQSPADVIVDGVFGTGLNAEVRGLARKAIETVNARSVPVVAVDIASGVNSDTGAIMAVAVKAAMTVTFGFAKFGHLSYPGADYCGDLRVVDIGFAPRASDEIAPSGAYLEARDVRGWIKPRPFNSHKGMYGHVMVIAGSKGKSGAVLLAARGALRAGAGLVTAAVPACVADVVASGQAELMTEPIADFEGHFDGGSAVASLSRLVGPMSSLVVGPGMGVSPGTRELVEWLIEDAVTSARPMLLDADALNILAQIGAERLKRAKGPVVLTPHPGEMSRLLGSGTREINADRISAARRLSDATGAVVLLKGARSVITGPGGEVYINSTGNPGMSTPGMGDALSGMVGALIGQRLDPLRALAFGTFLHGLAADRVAERYGRVGYIVTDLLEELPRAMDALVG